MSEEDKKKQKRKEFYELAERVGKCSRCNLEITYEDEGGKLEWVTMRDYQKVKECEGI